MNLPTKEELAAKVTAPFPSHTSLGLLRKAVDTQEQRARDYNKPDGERSMQHTVDMFNVISGRSQQGSALCLSESEGWLFMMCLKFAREAQAGDPYDSLLDLTSYSALYGESRLKEGKNFGKAPQSNPGDAWTYATVIRGAEAPPVSEEDGMRSRMVKALTGIKDKFGRDTAKQILVYGAGVEKIPHVPDDKIANVLGLCEMLDAAKSTTS